jgi:hypothetical protein
MLAPSDMAWLAEDMEYDLKSRKLTTKFSTLHEAHARYQGKNVRLDVKVFRKAKNDEHEKRRRKAARHESDMLRAVRSGVSTSRPLSSSIIALIQCSLVYVADAMSSRT